MAVHLSRKVPLAELHCHLGAAVTPSIMWSIAHAQGIKLPTRDYWDFRDLITVHPRRPKSFDGYLQLFHWTELIQSSPIAVERAVYEVIGGAYRKNNMTTTELRFNPMKRNRGGEQDLDHIIAAAVRGMDRATLEYPVKPGLLFCLDRAFPYELNEIIVEKAIAWRDRGVVGVDIAGAESATFRVADYRRSSAGPASTASGSPSTPASPGPWRRSPGSSTSWSRTGSATASRRPTTCAPWRCSASGGSCGDLPHLQPEHGRRVGLGGVPLEPRRVPPRRRRYTISTDGPEMLKTYIRDAARHPRPPRTSSRSRSS